MPDESLADALAGLESSARRRYHRAARLIDSPSLMGLLAAEVARMDPATPPGARVLAGRARLRSARRVGVLAGSFNPLTLAHVALVEAARASAGLDAILWLISAHTINKERVERASFPDRLAQLVAFARGTPGHAVALTNRGLYVEEARALRAVLLPDTDLLMLVGYDKVAQIFDPRYYADRDAALRALFAEASLLAAPRAAAGRAELEALLARPENQPFTHHVDYIDMPPLYAGESSTAARDLAAKEDWIALKALVPPEGLALAAETGAYALGGMPAEECVILREQWLRALVRCAPSTRRSLRPCTEVACLATSAGPIGDEVREWLAAVSEGKEMPAPPPSMRRRS